MTTSRTDALTPPGIEDIRLGLQRILGAEFGPCWLRICAAAGIASTAVALDGPELDALLRAVAAESSMCQVLALSWRIRCTAARKLIELGR